MEGEVKDGRWTTGGCSASLTWRTCVPDCVQRNVEEKFQASYWSGHAPDSTYWSLPGFVPLQLTVDKFILNRASPSLDEKYVSYHRCVVWCAPYTVV